MNVPQNRRTALYVRPAAGRERLVRSAAKYIEKLAGGSSLAVIAEKPAEKCASLIAAIGEIYIPMGELVDAEAEIRRLEKELQSVESEIVRAEGKLNNKGFVDKAPPKLIEAERDKLEKYLALKKKLTETIETYK